MPDLHGGWEDLFPLWPWLCPWSLPPSPPPPPLCMLEVDLDVIGLLLLKEMEMLEEVPMVDLDFLDPTVPLPPPAPLSWEKWSCCPGPYTSLGIQFNEQVIQINFLIFHGSTERFEKWDFYLSALSKENLSPTFSAFNRFKSCSNIAISSREIYEYGCEI